jgi:hypothetical protein
MPGIIPDAAIATLTAMGVHCVFTPGSDIRAIVEMADRFLSTTDTAQELE